MMHAPRLTIPAGWSARIYCTSPMGEDEAFVVKLSPAGDDETPLGVTAGGLGALITHDPGQSWPDRTGVALAAAAMERGGIVMLAFPRLMDAIDCQRRLTVGAGR